MLLCTVSYPYRVHSTQTDLLLTLGYESATFEVRTFPQRHIRRYCPPSSRRLSDEISHRGLLDSTASILKPLLAACRCCMQAWAWLGREAYSVRQVPSPLEARGYRYSNLPINSCYYHLSAKLRNPLDQECRGARSSNASRDLYPMRAAAWTFFRKCVAFSI